MEVSIWAAGRYCDLSSCHGGEADKLLTIAGVCFPGIVKDDGPLDAVDPLGYLPLHQAVLRGDPATVARLLERGIGAMAVAADQEMVAKIEESRAKLVEAEAEIPMAMAEAFQTGKLGILDYYKLRNVQADTDMRKSIASVGATSSAKA